MRLRRKSSPPVAPSADPSDIASSPVDGFVLNGAYDVQTAELVKRVMRPGDVGFDVGAHEGSILRHIVDASPQAMHHAFEPIPTLASGLRATFPSVLVHELALSEAKGTVTFNHVVSNPGYSGLRERRYDRPHEEISVIEVQTDRLVDVVGDQVAPRIVKIDVEGAERGVVRGGLDVLRRSRPFVVFEHGLGAADFYDTTPGEMHDLLHEDLGLSVTLIANWLAGTGILTREQFIDEFSTGRNYYFLAYPGSPGGD